MRRRRGPRHPRRGIDRWPPARWPGADRLAGAQIEARPVQIALDLPVADIAFGQWNRCMGAFVGNGVEVAVALHDRELGAADLHRNRRFRSNVSYPARSYEVAHDATSALMLTASSASRVCSSWPCSSGTPILRMMSAKKPCTTSRRASDSEIPRLRR